MHQQPILSISLDIKYWGAVFNDYIKAVTSREIELKKMNIKFVIRAPIFFS